ncbi:hypothetical protein LTR56_015001 [Elasticomyces elasticus]|nr:hypothetical protein LTR56_015001 [Elasticomyces elasticus]KAK3646965.1 hypothetical protein LTR22_013992 [Elasticomyces elasticus]KAK4916960.1 hypothetical protein LTR49_015135 [Elasticomyces elasticus]KAK5754214.1 hypothetical protein LTS12_015742 [Elasticomyces elasticus]
MAQAPVLYRETRLTPTPSSPAHVLNIDTTGSSLRQSLTRAGSKRPFDDISGNDEDSYARKHLATEGSVFFRSKARSPRSFLWRVLDDRKVLEVQAVDLVKDRAHENADSWITFRIAVKDGIQAGGVQFADPHDTDALECFILTEGKELLTVTLRRDLLTRASVPSEFDGSTCVKRFSSSFMSVRHVYRFHAVSSLELLFSLADGGLVHLRRKANENGSQWRETFFSEGGWRGTLTLKGFNPFAGRPTVKYGKLDLDPSAIADMAMSPDGNIVWTISLDHSLRAWSATTGKVVLKQDLLDEAGPKDGRQPYLLSAEQGRLLQVVTLPSQSSNEPGTAVSTMDQGDLYMIVVHSPKDHQVKFYNAKTTRTLDGAGVGLEDMFAGSRLTPPVDELLNTNIWHLEHFHAQPGRDGFDTQLWIRVRSGALCKTFMLTFDLPLIDGQHEDVSHNWSQGWSMADAGNTTVEELRELADYPGDLAINTDNAVTPSERWLQFLLYPGRFASASLETALHIYRKGRGLSGSGAGKGLKASDQPFEERLTTAITSKLILRRSANEQPDYVRYQQDIQAQWEAFWSVLAHLHGRRHESVGFAFDESSGMPWGVCADLVAPVRACNVFEKRNANTHLLFQGTDETSSDQLTKVYGDGHDTDRISERMLLSHVLVSARELRGTLSAPADQKLQDVARSSALKAQHYGPTERGALTLFEESGMENEITDDAFDALAVGLEPLGGVGGLTDETFTSLLAWLDDHTKLAVSGTGQVLARFGVLLTVDVAREMLMQAEAMLFDLLALVAFLVGDLEEGELDRDFHADRVHEAVASRLNRTELLLWLAGHRREKTVKINSAQRVEREEVDIVESVTLLEDIFIGDWEPCVPAKVRATMPELLTLWSSSWVGGVRITEGSWDGITTHILSRLVKAKEVDLAQDFMRFTSRSTHWSIYVQARLRVLTGGYAQASLDLREAAEGIGAGHVNDTANLILAHEQDAFGNGEAAYFQHVSALFEKLKVYSYVADFARLALDHTPELRDFAASMARVDTLKHEQGSPALAKLDAAHEETQLLQLKETRDEILNRLFNALVLTGRYSDAHAALAEIEGLPMKRAGLKKLIDACVKQDCVPALLSLQWNKHMVEDADKVLLDLAKKDLASGSTGTSTPYYQVLYAFRTQQLDFQGAAEILHDHLQMMRYAPKHRAAQDPEDETLLQCYVLLINTLACCGEDDAWVLAEPIHGVHEEGTKRRLVTLADVRREYTSELDNRSQMLLGRFAVVGGGDAMDVL